MVTTDNVDRNADLPDLLLQYAEFKDNFPNDILVMQVGHFYETYFQDAFIYGEINNLNIGSKRDMNEKKKDKNDNDSDEIDLYTGKKKKLTVEELRDSTSVIAMAGAPCIAFDEYVERVLASGRRLVVVDQLEDSNIAKKENRVVKRGLVRIITGKDKEEGLLTQYVNTWFCCVYKDGEKYSVAFCDINTSDMFVTCVMDEVGVLNEIARFRPIEILMHSDVSLLLKERIEKEIDLNTMFSLEDKVYLIDKPTSVIEHALSDCNTRNFDYLDIANLKSLYVTIKYINYTRQMDFKFSKNPVFYSSNSYMLINRYSRANLELTNSLRDRGNVGTLLSVLDKCGTSMGRRLLKTWLDEPVLSKAVIERRLDCVSELKESAKKRREIKDEMKGISDISKIIGALKFNRARTTDIVSLRNSLNKLPALKSLLISSDSKMLVSLYENLYTFDGLRFLLEKAMLDNPSKSVADGFVLKSGYNKDLDTVRDMIENSNKYIRDLEEKERDRTGIKNLKILRKSEKCFIEVSKGNLDKVPDNYILNKELKGSIRYTTPEVDELERNLLSAIEKSKAIELELYEEIKAAILNEHKKLSDVCDVLAALDVFCSLAEVADENKYVRPKINTEGYIHIVGGRHPVIEQLQGNFVSNDTYIDEKDNRFLLITGPNMAGKSTYMRQIALIAIMTQIGSFVPADDADMPIIDKIYTRIGASDNISAGKSTYMVEMTEVKDILDNVTKSSLVLLDEIGRGTSTSDGLAIAQAVTEYMYDKVGCKTLFATHYHELIALEDSLKGLKNYHMSVIKTDDGLEFVRKLEKGGLSESYGIDVAKLAGLPDVIINRATEILNEVDGRIMINTASSISDTNELYDKLRKIDKDNLSPSMAYYYLMDVLECFEKHGDA